MNEDAGHVQLDLQIEKIEIQEANVNQLSLFEGEAPFPMEEMNHGR